MLQLMDERIEFHNSTTTKKSSQQNMASNVANLEDSVAGVLQLVDEKVEVYNKKASKH